MADKQLPAQVVPRGNPITISNYDELVKVADIIARSGLAGSVHANNFDQKRAETAVKIMAGLDYGLTPFQALEAFHVVSGKAVKSYQFVSRLIKNSGVYDFKVKRLDEECCILEFTKNGKKLEPDSKWDASDTARAEMASKDNYRHYPRRMNFARALTEGANIHCAELFGGTPVICAEDLGAVIEGQVEELPETQPEPKEETKKPRGAKAGNSAATADASTTAAESVTDAEVVTGPKSDCATTAVTSADTQTDTAATAESTSSDTATTTTPAQGADDPKSAPAGSPSPASNANAAAPAGAQTSNAEPAELIASGATIQRPGDKEVAELIQLKESLGVDVNQVLMNYLDANKVVPSGVAMTEFKKYWTFEHFNAIKAEVQAQAKAK